MSTLQRAIIGSVLGAIAVLILHPLTQPILVYGIWPFYQKPLNPFKPHNSSQVPEPNTPENATVWITIGAEQIASGKNLTTNELLTLVEISQKAREQEPTNAYWWQSESIFQANLGNKEEAIQAWKGASLCKAWNDFQNEAILKSLRKYQVHKGKLQAWQHGAGYQMKSGAFARLVLELGRELMPDADEKLRFATIVNGRLVRDGGKSKIITDWGHKLVEAAASGQISSSRHSLTRFEQYDFVQKLNDEGLTEEATQVSKILSDNEAYSILTNNSTLKEDIDQYFQRALFTPTLPGILLISSIFPFVISLIGKILDNKKQNSILSKPWFIGALTLVSGILIYSYSKMLLPTLWAVLSLSALLLCPKFIYKPSNAIPGTFFSVFQGVLGSLCLLGFALSSLLATLPARALELTSLPTGLTLWPQETFINFSILTFFGSLAYSQVVAYKERRPCYTYIGKGLFQFGLTSGIAGIMVAIIIAPVMISLSAEVSDKMSTLFQNETSYYLNQ